MKKQFLLFQVVLCMQMLNLKAQVFQKCATVAAMEQQESHHTGYIQSSQNLYHQFYASHQQRAISDTFLIVKVVVHVVYNAPQENLHDSVIFNQISQLNKDFGRMNADTVNMRAVFAPIAGVDSRIRFQLADTDPQGNPTNGITRTATSTGTFFDLLNGGLAEGVKSSATGGIDPWDQNRYLNIWVCDMSIPFVGPAILGYAVPPSGLPNWDPGSTAGISDGVVIQYQVFGANNPNTLTIGGNTYAVKGRTPVHEVGHYLGLRHIWGDATACAGEDGIDDTPRATDASQQDCDNSKNTCADTIAGIDMPDMIENYMDYSAEDCQNSFTMQQVQFMRWVILTHRSNVASPSFTGFNSPELAANFTLFPNPANDFIEIKCTRADEYKWIKIINLQGQTVDFVELNKTNEVINTTNYPNGLYLVEVGNNHRILRKKITIAH